MLDKFAGIIYIKYTIITDGSKKLKRINCLKNKEIVPKKGVNYGQIRRIRRKSERALQDFGRGRILSLTSTISE